MCCKCAIFKHRLLLSINNLLDRSRHSIEMVDKHRHNRVFEFLFGDLQLTSDVGHGGSQTQGDVGDVFGQVAEVQDLSNGGTDLREFECIFFRDLGGVNFVD
jgi:hypothetical protein